MIKNFKWLFLVSLTFIACTSDDETTVVNNTSDGLPLTAGSADFTKYVALGDSFAAGFSDNALFIEGQKGAYPNILSQQFALVGGGVFNTPLMNDNIGGFQVGGVQSTSFLPRLYFNGVGPAMVSGTSTTDITAHLTGPFNNMGVPGAKVGHLDFPGYGSSMGNPYFARFASTPMATLVDDAVAQNPTFFTLWIGGNDVLGYATSGGSASSPVTPPATFDAAYNSIINKLTANNRKGAIANLPYVNTLPYFTTVPVNPIPGLPASSATQLNQLFGAINQICVATGQPTRFSTLVDDDGNSATAEANPLLISDESLALDLGPYIVGALSGTLGTPTATYLGSIYGKARHAKKTTSERDYILLPARTLIGTAQSGAPAPFNTIGVSYPMQDATTLTISEAAEIKTATDAYNITIQNAASAKGLALFDAKATMDQLSTVGITGNNYNVTSTYVTGGGFSLDGVHPSPRGYALIANKFLEAINTAYGSNFKGVDFGDYRILFPASL